MKYDALSAPQWVGTFNYDVLAYDEYFHNALRNSLYFVALAVPLRIATALALALALHRHRKGCASARVAVFLPSLIPDTAFALIGLWIFNPIYGPLNLFLISVGISPPSWLVDPSTAKLVFVLMSLLQIGEGFVILMAARNQVPNELFESSAIAGSNRWQTFRHITFPLLVPWLLLVSVRDIMMSFVSTFTQAHLMTQGDPYYATMFSSLFIYEEAFDHFKFGLASAMTLCVFGGSLVIVAFLVAMARSSRYGVEV